MDFEPFFFRRRALKTFEVAARMQALAAPVGGGQQRGVDLFERGHTRRVVFVGQPALSLAGKLQKRAGRIGAPVPSYDGIGGELWQLVMRCRAAGLDPEAELRTVARTFRDRLAEVERTVAAQGREVADLTAEEWAQQWS